MRRLLIIAIPVAITIAAIVVTITEVTPPDLALSTTNGGFTIVGDSWHYVGNESLYIEPGSPGELVCEYGRTPQTVCQSNWGRNTAAGNIVGDAAGKYLNEFGQPAYLVTAETNRGFIHDTLVLLNSKIYCIVPDPNYPTLISHLDYNRCQIR